MQAHAQNVGHSQHVTLDVRIQSTDDMAAWFSQYSGMFVFLGTLVAMQYAVGAIEQLLIGWGWVQGKQVSKRERMVQELSQNIAKGYNMDTSGEGKDSTGVMFDDVQVRCAQPHCVARCLNVCILDNYRCVSYPPGRCECTRGITAREAVLAPSEMS